MLEDKEIKVAFKNTQIKDTVTTILENVENFEFEKSNVSGYSINIWRIKPVVDEGSFLYYEREADRDADYELLTGLVEAKLG